jgi:hypothetical protein
MAVQPKLGLNEDEAKHRWAQSASQRTPGHLQAVLEATSCPALWSLASKASPAADKVPDQAQARCRPGRPGSEQAPGLAPQARLTYIRFSLYIDIRISIFID